MNPAQQEAFRACLHPSVTSTENLVGWLNSFGWLVSVTGLDAYRDTLQEQGLPEGSG